MNDELPVYASLLASDLPDGWKVPHFEDLVYFQEGPGIRNWQYVDEGIPFVNIRCLVNGRLDRASMSHIHRDEALGKYRHFLLDTDDYVVSSSGTLGRIAVVYEEDLPCMLNTSVIRMRPRDDRLDRRFLRYFLTSNYYQQQILSFATGSAQLNYGPFHLRQMFIVAPPPEEQRAIAAVLGSLDDKIEQNRRTGAKLEGLARAVFKAWFVDFEPVKAKAAGATAFPGMPPETFAALPTRLIESPLGLVPEGWEVTALSELMTFQGGAQPPANTFVDSPRQGYIRLVQIRDFYTNSHLTYVPDSQKLKRFDRNDVMIARYGSSSQSAGDKDSLARICRGLEGAYNVALVRVDPKLSNREFLYWYLQSSVFKATIQGMGARSVQSGFRKEDLDVIPIVRPDAATTSAFEMIATMFWKFELQLRDQSDKLATLRDYLLPRLLSGRVRVRGEIT